MRTVILPRIIALFRDTSTHYLDR